MQFLKTPFKDPIEARGPRKEQVPFHDPTKEQATTGRFMCAGDGHGVGFRQPVGKEKASGPASGPIPQKAFAFDPEKDNVELNVKIGPR
jgi:hypothetical protein